MKILEAGVEPVEVKGNSRTNGTTVVDYSKIAEVVMKNDDELFMWTITGNPKAKWDKK